MLDGSSSAGGGRELTGRVSYLVLRRRSRGKKRGRLRFRFLFPARPIAQPRKEERLSLGMSGRRPSVAQVHLNVPLAHLWQVEAGALRRRIRLLDAFVERHTLAPTEVRVGDKGPPHLQVLCGAVYIGTNLGMCHAWYGGLC